MWHLQSVKCIYTFKHKHPVSAVALDDNLCISGDEGIPIRPEDPPHKEGKGGEVKVWNMKNGDLIKVLDCRSDWLIISKNKYIEINILAYTSLSQRHNYVITCKYTMSTCIYLSKGL